MMIAEMKRLLADQQYKCDSLLNKVVKVTLFGDFDNSTDRYHPKKYHGLTGANSTINEFDNRIEIPPCPSVIMNRSCWSLSDTSGTSILSCPSAWIIRHNLTNNYLKNLTVSSKVCLANNQNFSSASWNLCAFFNDDYPPEFMKWLWIIRTISLIGYTTSLITLTVAVVIFSLLRKLWNPRNRLHMHLFASFIMRAFMSHLKYWIFIDGERRIISSWDILFIDGEHVFVKTLVCKILTSLWQYSIVANYSWILMEGLYLHNLIILTPCSKTNTITLYILLGWGLPGLVVVPWIVIRATMEDTLCWTTNKNPWLFLIISVPIIISILLNFVLFLNIVRVLFVKLKTSVYLQQKKMQYKKWARSTLILIPLFGAHYVLFLGLSYYRDYDIELVWLFCDQLSQSFQGTFVALLYCLLNGEVRTEMRRIWRTWQSKRDIDSFNSGHREFRTLSKNLKNKTKRKRYRSEGDNGPSLANIAMRELSLP
ncbi:secretin receptor-like isoform X1 [Odontomachus brunneus]|uniref:secretin receptor-like isoform X1 n=1 Tax=Odontomachus brunneus TaxID=486640 RepID=UPI0013F2252D|nr:secretin receptor-like isoform X1 [Odontomachus brunneus]